MSGVAIPDGCPFVIDARKLGAPLPEPGVCWTCGGRLPPDLRDRPKHCSQNHARAANKKRRKGLSVVYEPGRCWCGAEAGRMPPLRYCSPGCRQGRKPLYPGGQLSPFRVFLRCVRYPHSLSWLGPKVGLAEGDPDLAAVALGLAQEGRLFVYVTRDGKVGEVGWPRKQKRLT